MFRLAASIFTSKQSSQLSWLTHYESLAMFVASRHESRTRQDKRQAANI